MTALSIIISIVLILVSIVLIAAVLMQQGQRQGLGAIGGGAETFLGKNAASSLFCTCSTARMLGTVIPGISTSSSGVMVRMRTGE